MDIEGGGADFVPPPPGRGGDWGGGENRLPPHPALPRKGGGNKVRKITIKAGGTDEKEPCEEGHRGAYGLRQVGAGRGDSHKDRPDTHPGRDRDAGLSRIRNARTRLGEDRAIGELRRPQYPAARL